MYVVYLTSHTYELTPPLVPTGRIGHYVLCRHFQCNIPSCHNIELNTPQLYRIFETVSELDFAIIHAAGEFHTMAWTLFFPESFARTGSIMTPIHNSCKAQFNFSAPFQEALFL